MSKCILGCGRSLATGSQTQICSTCLSNLAGWRRRPAAHRIKYRERWELAGRRQEEIIKYPKGYKILGGRPVETHIPLKPLKKGDKLWKALEAKRLSKVTKPTDADRRSTTSKV